MPVDRLGIPDARPDNRSPGRGDSNSIGDRKGRTMGNGDEDGIGVANDPKTYHLAATQPVCMYCPAPVYTDEARKTKLQGTVMLMVLVSADGRAMDMRISKGVGAGLDERAIETVRGWRFVPARDAAKHPVATWVTIEVVFRLF